MQKKLSYFNKISLILGLIFLYLPLAVIVIFSFNKSHIVNIWLGFSLKWYYHLFANQQLLNAIGNSLIVAFVSSTLSVFIGTVLGVVLARFYNFGGYKFLNFFIYTPIILPDIILGVGFLLTFTFLLIPIGIFSIILAHTVVSSCYVAILVQSALNSMDKKLEEAAMDLGYNSISAFLYVTLPLIMPVIITSWFLSFILSFDDLIIASFNHGISAVTLPIKLYSQIRLGISPEINVVCTLTFIIILFVAMIIYFVNKHFFQHTLN